MKKGLMMLGVAAIALASCTQNEVMEVAESRAIGFDAFVGKTTKAVTEIDASNLTQFNVFGYHKSTGNWAPDYENVAVTGGSDTWTAASTAYWQAENVYEFAAYSDGNGSLDKVVNFDPATKKLTFSNYEVKGNDLIAAVTSVGSQTDINNYPSEVEFEFKHLLSQIQFTFTNTDSRSYKMEISDLTIEAIKKGISGSFTSAGATWDGTGTAETYTISGITDIAEGDLSTEHPTGYCIILPQNTDNLFVEFTATCTDKNGTTIATGNFKAPLDLDASAPDSKWSTGFKYNYTVELNASTIDPDNTKEIKFTVKDIAPWEDNSDDIETQPEKE